MKMINLFILVSLTSSCSMWQYLNGDTERFSMAKEREEQDKARQERNAQARKEKEAEDARIQERLSRKNLQNTASLNVGMTMAQVEKIILEPSSVAANKKETIWQYNLFRFASLNADLVPFKIVFIGERVSSFGIDQEQVERDRAKVVIQKEMSGEKKDD